MNRYTSILFRAYLPAAALLLVSIGAMVWTSVAGNIHFLNGWVGVLRWLPPIALLAALVMAAVATLRMWRGQRADVAPCASCAGPMGGLERGRGGDSRSCMSCGAGLDEQATGSR